MDGRPVLNRQEISLGECPLPVAQDGHNVVQVVIPYEGARLRISSQ